MSEKSHVLILGCGYTGRRVAQRLLGRGWRVTATAVEPARLGELAAAGAVIHRLDVREPASIHAALAELEPGVRVLHSIPVIRDSEGYREATPPLLAELGSRPARVVYLSTTAVYGKTVEVDETTPAAPDSVPARLRLEAERAVQAGPWPALVLRPAAIYGPGRGVQEAIRRGRFRRVGEGDRVISRVHVDDLAALVEAALLCELTGAYPVADAEPCTSREIAEFCAERLGVPLPPSMSPAPAHPGRRGNRRVRGGAIFRLLGLPLRYPSYRTGVPAALDAGQDGLRPAPAVWIC